MTRFTLLTASVFALSLGSACRREGAPPPRLLSSGNLGLMPVLLSDHIADSALLVSAASADEPAKASAAAAAAAVTVDDSTADGIAKAYVDILNAARMQQWATIVIPEQQPIATELAQAVQPIAEVVIHLRQVMGEKFAGHAFQASLGESIPAEWIQRWTVASVEVDAADPNTATAKFKQEGGTLTGERKLKKVDAHWRVEEQNLPPAIPPELATMVTQLADALRAVAARIENNEITDPQAAENEIKQAVSNPASAVPAETAAAPAQPAPAATPPAAQPAPKANNAAKPQQQRSKSELEQQMDDAAGRSVLGGGI